MDSQDRIKMAQVAPLSLDEKAQLKASRQRAVQRILFEAQMLLVESEQVGPSSQESRIRERQR